MIGYYFIQHKYKYVRECEMSGIDKATRKIESLETEENENLLHNKKINLYKMLLIYLYYIKNNKLYILIIFNYCFYYFNCYL